MKTKIIGVLGLGIFGQTVAEELSQFGQEVIVIDSKEDNVTEIADLVSKAVIGDITDLELLEKAGIDQCDAVVIATGNNLESSVLAVRNCKKLKIPHIVTKARSSTFEEVLYAVGADHVISPERESGKNLASSLLRQSIGDIYYLEGDISVIEFKVPKAWVGRSIKDLDIRSKFDLNLIGIRSSKGEPLTTNIPIEAPLIEDSSLVAVSSSQTFEKFDYLGYFR